MLAPQTEELGLASRWGWVVFRGVLAILFGLLAFAQPAAIGFGLVLLFGVYAFVGGVSAIFAAARSGRADQKNWGTLLLEGILGIAVGLMAVFWPATSALAFVWVIGLWALIGGGLEIASAIRLRKVIEHEWALGLAGALSIVFGVLMLYRPLAGRPGDRLVAGRLRRDLRRNDDRARLPPAELLPNPSRGRPPSRTGAAPAWVTHGPRTPNRSGRR